MEDLGGMEQTEGIHRLAYDNTMYSQQSKDFVERICYIGVHVYFRLK